MKLAFVIPAYNEEALIGKCVESVLAEVKRSGRDCEIVVVNNNSTDRTAEIAAAAGARVVDEKQKGIVSARDAGFHATTAELVANIDGDTMVTPGWLDIVFDEFEKDPRLVCLSGPYVYYDLNPWQRFLTGAFYGLTTLIYWLNRYVLRVGSVVQGGNFVLKRDAWIKARIQPGDQILRRGHRRRRPAVQGRQREIHPPAQDEDLRSPPRRRRHHPHRPHLYAQLLLGHLRRQARDA